MINLYNQDCMEAMSKMKNNHFDLAIVDPPYGLPKSSIHGRGKLKNRAMNRDSEKMHEWDIAPKQEYFWELMRVSKNQIIWGGNHFPLPPTREIIVWDKCQPWNNFSQVEMAWTSFNGPAQLFKYDNRTGGKIHPTQKPVALYQWLLAKYAKPYDKILDTHLGSGSIALACFDLGHNLEAYEIDQDYFEAAENRLNDHTLQIKLF
jgi:site-specific DNA-methyltransferase (adenine-specific)